MDALSLIHTGLVLGPENRWDLIALLISSPRLRFDRRSLRVAAVLSSGLPLDAIPAERLCSTALRAVSSDTLHELLGRIGRRRRAWTSIKREILNLLNGDRKRCHQ
jgi:hypothetical protein